LVHGLTTQVASRDMTPRSKGQRSRSQRNVTYPVKNCNNSVPGSRIKFIHWIDCMQFFLYNYIICFYVSIYSRIINDKLCRAIIYTRSR